MVNVGDVYSFTPVAYKSTENGAGTSKQKDEESKVKGIVIQVNRHHRWFRVEYPTQFYGNGYECIKF